MLGASTSTLSAAWAWKVAEDRRSPERGQCITTIVWDSRDRLVEVKVNGASVANYGYDTNNLRVLIDDTQGKRRVLLDGLEELMELETGAMSQVTRWDRDPSGVDGLLAQYAGSASYVVSDALGSVHGMTDSSGAVVIRQAFDAFGSRATSTETVSTSWGYSGRRHDPTSLAYYRARHYDPSVGKFTSRDPRLVTSGENFYAYVNNNPTMYRDPSGNIMELDAATQNAIYAPKTDVPLLPWQRYRVVIGMSHSPTGQRVLERIREASHGYHYRVYAGLKATVDGLDLSDRNRDFWEANRSRLNAITAPVGTPGCGYAAQVVSAWFKHDIERYNSRQFVDFISHAEAVGHEMVHAASMFESHRFKMPIDPADYQACSAQQAIHEELYGSGTFDRCIHPSDGLWRKLFDFFFEW